MRRRAGIAWALLLGGLTPQASLADDFDAWFVRAGRLETIGAPAEKRLPAGSLQKPFLVRAWASSHLSDVLPRVSCSETSGCWRPGGHGTLDLRAAIRESCNTYFRQLARDTPGETIAAVFRAAGFSWSGEITEAEAIGLPGPAGVSVAPERLLGSYADLVRTPWVDRDDLRLELLDGMKDAAQAGTASGLRLWGLWGKTGTVPALDGVPLRTSGLVMVVDDAGFAFLGLLRRGTGREAAVRAGDAIARLRTGVNRRPPAVPSAKPTQTKVKARGLTDPVRVRLLDELRLKEVRLRNVGPGPVDSSRGFLGPGASVVATHGAEYSAGVFEITARSPEFVRRVRAALRVPKTDGPLRLLATMNARDYANGILKAELGTTGGPLRAQLAAAVLRYLQAGPRHSDADVCDSTHCAWFVGEGPVPRWLRPTRAVNEMEMARDLSDDEWENSVREARTAPLGPKLWTADCGGDPAPPHFIWGGGDRRVNACSRHPKGSGRVWRREWPSRDLTAVFHSPVEAIDVAPVEGQWRLRVGLKGETETRVRTLSLSYDDVHRRLAARLGWDALPAPASRVLRSSSGFVAEGVGFGHRAGLCLAP